MSVVADLRRVQTHVADLRRLIETLFLHAQRHGDEDTRWGCGNMRTSAAQLRAMVSEIELKYAETDKMREVMRAERIRLMRDIPRLAQRVAEGKAK